MAAAMQSSGMQHAGVGLSHTFTKQHVTKLRNLIDSESTLVLPSRIAGEGTDTASQENCVLELCQVHMRERSGDGVQPPLFSLPCGRVTKWVLNTYSILPDRAHNRLECAVSQQQGRVCAPAHALKSEVPKPLR
jgi:hypothetical protein